MPEGERPRFCRRVFGLGNCCLVHTVLTAMGFAMMIAATITIVFIGIIKAVL